MQGIDHLRDLPAETEWLEFKRNRHMPDQLGQYLSALANGACVAGKPTGYLIFGVDDETHQVVGTGFEPRVVNHPDGRVVLFEVGAARDQPVSFYGTAYVRVGARKTELSRHPEKARAIWTRGTDWSAEVPQQSPRAQAG